MFFISIAEIKNLINFTIVDNFTIVHTVILTVQILFTQPAGQAGSTVQPKFRIVLQQKMVWVRLFRLQRSKYPRCSTSKMWIKILDKITETDHSPTAPVLAQAM